MIGLAMANDTPSVTAPGARGRVTGSNPLAYAVPTGSSLPILLDMATSTVAGGKVSAAHALGKLIPEGWVVDVEGRPDDRPGRLPGRRCADPDGRPQGLRPRRLDRDAGGRPHGGGDHPPGRPLDRRRSLRADLHGAAFIAVNIGAMMPLDAFKRRVDALAREIRESPRTEGADRVYLPGEIEWERRKQSLERGIVLPEDVRTSVEELSQELGLESKMARLCDAPVRVP